MATVFEVLGIVAALCFAVPVYINGGSAVFDGIELSDSVMFSHFALPVKIDVGGSAEPSSHCILAEI